MPHGSVRRRGRTAACRERDAWPGRDCWRGIRVSSVGDTTHTVGAPILIRVGSPRNAGAADATARVSRPLRPSYLHAATHFSIVLCPELCSTHVMLDLSQW